MDRFLSIKAFVDVAETRSLAETELVLIDIEGNGAIGREMIDGLSFGRLCELAGVPPSADFAMKALP
jgi:hypothetical protein